MFVIPEVFCQKKRAVHAPLLLVQEKQRAGYLLWLPMLILVIWVATKKAILRIFHRKLAINAWLFDGGSAICRFVKEHEASGRALDIAYQHEDPSYGDFLSRLWLRVNPIAQSVRNRCYLVEYLLGQEISSGRKSILSIAAGAAKAVLQTVRRDENAEALLLDIDRQALRVALKAAEVLSLNGRVQGEIVNVLNHLKWQKIFRERPACDVAEMIGIVDYLDDEQAIMLMENARRHLVPGGTIITANISRSHRFRPETLFLHIVMGWRPMHYRHSYELQGLLERAGFVDVELHTEALGFFFVAVGRNA